MLDVATGGGHVARRLREAGANVVTVDPAPGMQADVIAPAEHLPFADGSFDAVATRLAAHHFADALGALKEMARVASGRVVICDNTFVSESSEEADRLRDPSHVRNYGVGEWESFFELAGLEIAEQRLMERPLEIEPWLARVELHGRGCRARARAARPPHRRRLDGPADARHQGSQARSGDHRRQRHAARRPGPHRQRGPLPRPAQQGVRDERRRGRHAGQGRPGRRGHPGLRHGRERRRPRPARTRASSSFPRASRPTRSTRRSTQASARSSASPSTSPRTRCCARTRTSGRRA